MSRAVWLYFGLAVVVFGVAWEWAMAIRDAKRDHPDYTGDDFP